MLTRVLAPCLLLLLCAPVAWGVGVSESFESLYSAKDVTLGTDPQSAFWQAATPVYAEVDNFGRPVPSVRTEVRSRWTAGSLYLLFRSPYEELSLNPKPVVSAETNRLWEWNVAELFIGTESGSIRRYKEFEVSPQGEWVDLDVNLDLPDHTVGWTWNSGVEVRARIDREAKVWYGAMRIPFPALDPEAPHAGRTYRANLFRTEGPPERAKAVAWRAPMSETFHTPERFGTLKLVSR